MSGVVGCYRRDGGTATEPTSGMAERIAHRGPDGGDEWAEGSVGLGHRLLRTTSEADRSAFPRREGRLVVTGDVRLDNRSELIGELDVDGKRPADGELLVEAYRRWGTDCPRHLLGAFAFAIWDGRRGRLVCARDHMGVKPLFYHLSDDLFAFGSEPKAVLSLPSVSRRPNERRVGDYLLGRLDDERSTFYRDVDRLPPAHTLTVHDGDARLERYWELDPSRELDLGSDEAYRRRFRELFVDAVRCRLRGPGPVGSFLSGGVDSSSVACVARDLLAERGDGPLHTFSAVFDELPVCDEREYIDAVLGWGSGGFAPHFVDGDGTNPLLDVERHLYHQDGPFYPSLFMLVWRLLHEADRRGVRVLLHGYGGDQTVGSDTRAYPCELAREGRVADLYAELRGIHERHPETTYRGLLWHEVLSPLVPGAVRRLWHARNDPERHVTDGIASVDPAFARRTGLVDRSRRDATATPPRSQRRLQHRYLTSGEPSFNLELNDMAAAAVGVETRYPYFDRRLVEFCLALPPEQNVRGGLGRMILRRALAGVVPPAVRWRDDKTEFSPNVVHTLRTYGLPCVEETLFDGRLLAGAYLDEADLRASFERFRAEGDPADARNLLMATTLELWLRRHVS